MVAPSRKKASLKFETSTPSQLIVFKYFIFWKKQQKNTNYYQDIATVRNIANSRLISSTVNVIANSF